LNDAARFLNKVNKSDACWDWSGAKIGNGYGYFRLGKKMVLAHRFSYFLFCGNITSGMMVLHKCDNPSCVRPSHLYLGTQVDNMLDMKIKQRGHKPIGESNGRSKLKHDDVVEIRRLYQTGKITQRILGIMFRVSPQQISEIVLKKSWREN
jgi:hypothetical protein